jgi:hypothetical protein
MLARSVVDALKTFVTEQMTAGDLVSLQIASGRVQLPCTGNRQTLLSFPEQCRNRFK